MLDSWFCELSPLSGNGHIAKICSTIYRKFCACVTIAFPVKSWSKLFWCLLVFSKWPQDHCALGPSTANVRLRGRWTWLPPLFLLLSLSPYIVWSLDRALQSNAIPARSRNPADQTPLHRSLYDNYSWFSLPWVPFLLQDVIANSCTSRKRQENVQCPFDSASSKLFMVRVTAGLKPG